eukprot:1161598-Pelagomonas_calceolata.AAC.4
MDMHVQSLTMATTGPLQMYSTRLPKKGLELRVHVCMCIRSAVAMLSHELSPLKQRMQQFDVYA